MNNQPFKISIEYYDSKISVEKDHSDITDEIFIEMIEKIVFSTGFSKENIERHIIEWGEELKSKSSAL